MNLIALCRRKDRAMETKLDEKNGVIKIVDLKMYRPMEQIRNGKMWEYYVPLPTPSEHRRDILFKARYKFQHNKRYETRSLCGSIFSRRLSFNVNSN